MSSPRDDEFRRYVLARRGDLLRTATLLCAGDPHAAEDLVQATLTRLYVAWPGFRRAANPDGYARRTLVHALLDERRRPWHRRERVVADVPERPAAAGAGRSDDLHRALRDLPPRMRAVVVFRYLHDLGVAETAELLGCSEGTVKSQTARALDKLRAVLDLGVDHEPSTAPARRPAVLRGARHA